LQKTWTYSRAIAANVGATVKWKGLSLTIPSNALVRNEFIKLDDVSGVPAVAEADASSPDINKGQTTIFGPKNLYGTDAARQNQYIDLNAPVTLTYTQTGPAGEADQVLTVQTLDSSKGIWKSVGLNSKGVGALDTGPTVTKTVTVP